MAFRVPAVMSNNVPVLGLENLLISVYEPVSPSSSEEASASPSYRYVGGEAADDRSRILEYSFFTVKAFLH